MPGFAQKLMDPVIDFVVQQADELGESPVWDARSGVLFWADALAPRVCAFNPTSGETRDWAMPAPIGSLALGGPGALLVALADGFHRLDLHDGDLRPLWTTALPRDNRFNDGKADRDGGFVCGTMQVEDDAPPGFLFRLRSDGTTDRIADGFGVTNAVCFSPDGRTLYAACSRVGVLWAWDYHPNAPLGPRRVVADVKALTGSAPDGATVDAAGGIWIALVRTGQLGRFTPDGTLDRVIDLPVEYPTCPAFGGESMDTLFVTSISRSRRLRAKDANAGRLLAITGLGVTGLVEATVHAATPPNKDPR
ncbi:MAG: SMP-30/gluconolactonase/LRE family protein [Rhodopila sp.]